MGQPYPYPLLALYFKSQCKKCDPYKSPETIQKEIEAIMELERQREEQAQPWPTSVTGQLILRPPFAGVKQFVVDFFGYDADYMAWNTAWGPDSKFICMECAQHLWGVDLVVQQVYGDGTPRFPARPVVRFACQECRKMTPNFQISWH